VSSSWGRALPAFLGGMVGGSGGIVFISAKYWLDGRKDRKDNRAAHMAVWRSGLDEWERTQGEDQLNDQGIGSLVRQPWYGTLERHLSDSAREKINHPRTMIVGALRPGAAMVVQEELDRIEREWKLK